MKFYRDYKKYAETLVTENAVSIDNIGVEDRLSFTPYIYNSCSADCKFCSEKLVRQGQVMVCDEICQDYTELLREAFAYAGEREIFLSLSGKEPSESPKQLEMISQAVKQSEIDGCLIKDRVMYSNLSGFVKEWDRLINVIKEFRLTRIECSRHFYEEERNQNIVQFKNGEGIRRNDTFIGIVKELQKYVPVKMVCVFQKGGVENVEDVVNYLEFARNIGVKEVVFRELSVFSDGVDRGKVESYITANRIELMDILSALSDNEFKINSIVEGYYYFSFVYDYMDMKVSFEMSDYEEMIKNHKGEELHKLIFYPNGELCRDWNMKGKIDGWR